MPILFMLIKLLSLQIFQEQREQRKVFHNAKDVVTILTQIILQREHLQLLIIKRGKIIFFRSVGKSSVCL